jgi:hypothetical protein
VLSRLADGELTYNLGLRIDLLEIAENGIFFSNEPKPAVARLRLESVLLGRFLRVARLQLIGASWLQLGGMSAKAGFAPLALLHILAELFEVGAASRLQLDLCVGGAGKKHAGCNRGQDLKHSHKSFLPLQVIAF